MKKQTKILLGVGALAVVGYLVWKNNQKPKNMVGADGKSPCKRGEVKTTSGGYTYCQKQDMTVKVYDQAGNPIQTK